MNKKNILYIVHNYNNFQKDYIESTAVFFDHVYVLVRYKPISMIVKFLPFKSLKLYDDSYVIDLENVPSNITVIKTPVWYLPWGFLYQFAGYFHWKVVDRIIRKYNIKFNIVHSHFLWTAGYVGKKIKEKYKVPLIVTGHGYDVYELPFENKSWMNAIKKVLDSAEEIVTVSEKNRNCLLELGLENSEINLLYNSYNNKLFHSIDKKSCRKELGISLNEKFCLCVGNLESVKAHQNLINAMKVISEKDTELICYIIGSGSLIDSLNKLVIDLELEKRVKILSARPHSEIVKWMGACDFFVLPSLMESGPIVVLEALACGKPVVSTNVGIVPNIIKNYNCGVVVEPGSIQQLVNGIKTCQKKHWSSDQIQNCVKEFSLDKRADKEIEIYKKLLSIK